MLRYKVVVSFMLVLMVAACQSAKPPFECRDKIGCVTIAPNEPIKIGVIEDTSGSIKQFGIEQQQVIELAVAEQNNQLLGHPVVLLNEDSLCTAEGGANVVLKILADPQVIGILGTTCSSSSAAVAKAMSTNGLVMISGGATGAALTALGGGQGSAWQAGFFRTVFNGSTQGTAIATFAYQKQGLRKIGIVNDGDTYTTSLTQVFKQAFSQLGGEIVMESTINKGDSDMKPVLAGMAKAKVDGVFMALYQQESSIMYAQAVEVVGLEKVTFLTTNHLLTKELFPSLSEKSQPLYLVDTTQINNAASLELEKRVTAKYSKPSGSFYNFAYDSVSLLFKAIEQVAIKEDDGTLHIGRQALREALYNTKDFAGMSGKLSCNTFGDCGAIAFDILQVNQTAKSVDEVKASIVYTYSPQK